MRILCAGLLGWGVEMARQQEGGCFAALVAGLWTPSYASLALRSLPACLAPKLLELPMQVALLSVHDLSKNGMCATL